MNDALCIIGPSLPGWAGTPVLETPGASRIGAAPASCRAGRRDRASALYRSAGGRSLTRRFLPGRSRPSPLRAGAAACIRACPCSCGTGAGSKTSSFFYGRFDRRR